MAESTPAAAATKYVFEGPTPVTDGGYDVYGDAWAAQWRATASVAAGEDVRDPAHYAQILGDESDPGLARFAHWLVLEGGRPVFDVWVVHVDGAVVFHADSEERTPINVIQGSWQESEGSEAWARVCDELAACAPSYLWF